MTDFDQRIKAITASLPPSEELPPPKKTPWYRERLGNRAWSALTLPLFIIGGLLIARTTPVILLVASAALIFAIIMGALTMADGRKVAKACGTVGLVLCAVALAILTRSLVLYSSGDLDAAVDTAKVEGTIASQARANGVPDAVVSCPDDVHATVGATFECTVSSASLDQATSVTAKVTNRDGDVWVSEPVEPAAAPDDEPGDEPASEPAPSQDAGTSAAPSTPAKKSYKALSSRKFKLLAKDPDSYAGKSFIVYGNIFQFDSATGADTFLAYTGPEELSVSYGYVNYDQNSILTGKVSKLKKLVEGDCFKAKVTVLGSYSYETQVGGNTTVPAFQVDSISVYDTTD